MLDILFVIGSPLLFFPWAAIHELSHLAMAKLSVGIRDWSVDLLPHFTDQGVLRFSSVQWYYTSTPTRRQFAAVSLAPRIPDLIGCALTICLPWPWLILTAPALVDLAYGSIGWTRASDCQKAAFHLGTSPWVLRVAGWSVALGTLAITIWRFL